MKLLHYAAAVVTVVMALAGGPAVANTCQAGNLTCPTTMPVDGYCECTSHGATQSGTVVTAATPHSTPNATAAGCGADPKAPGCR